MRENDALYDEKSIGTSVIYYKLLNEDRSPREKSGTPTTTKSAAYNNAANIDVIFLTGHRSYVALDHVRIVQAE